MFNKVGEIYDPLKGVVEFKGETLKVVDASIRGEPLDRLVYNAIFNDDKGIRGHTRWVIKSVAREMGVNPPPSRAFMMPLAGVRIVSGR